MTFPPWLKATDPSYNATNHPADVEEQDQVTPLSWSLNLLGRHSKRSPGLFFLTGVTFIYLLFEFAFNSRLLDAVGGISSADSIDGIEVCGRLLSGFAFALFFWPSLIASKSPRVSKVIRMCGLTATVMTSVYIGERMLVDHYVDESTPERRYAAANLMLLQQSLVSGDAHVQDLDLSRQQMNAPDGKAFLATFPMLLLQINDVEKRIADQKTTLVRRAVDKAYGGPVGAFNHYVDALQEIKTAYDGQYLPGSRKYQAALNTIPARQAEAWADYERSLRIKGLSPDSVPPAYYDRVRQEVRHKGVKVPGNWHPNDRAGFNQAIANSVKAAADNEYQTGVRKALGEFIAPSLSAEAFMLTPPIQHRLLAGLRFPCEVTVRLGYRTPAEFERGVYGRAVDLVTQQKLNTLNGRLADYADGALFEHSGKDSMRALIAPPIALAFSVLGAMAHIIKMTLLLIECLTHCSIAKGSHKIVAVFLLSISMLASFSAFLSSPITRQGLYQEHVHEAALKDQGGALHLWHLTVTNAIRGTIQVQPYAYPVFEWVRQTLLQDLDFGYHPDEGVKAPSEHNPEKPATCVKTA